MSPQLWRWTALNNRWVRVGPTGGSPQVPLPRAGHTMTEVRGVISVFGGSGYPDYMDNLWLYKVHGHNVSCTQGCTGDGQCDEDRRVCVCDNVSEADWTASVD